MDGQPKRQKKTARKSMRPPESAYIESLPGTRLWTSSPVPQEKASLSSSSNPPAGKDSNSCTHLEERRKSSKASSGERLSRPGTPEVIFMSENVVKQGSVYPEGSKQESVTKIKVTTHKETGQMRVTVEKARSAERNEKKAERADMKAERTEVKAERYEKKARSQTLSSSEALEWKHGYRKEKYNQSREIYHKRKEKEKMISTKVKHSSSGLHSRSFSDSAKDRSTGSKNKIKREKMKELKRCKSPYLFTKTIHSSPQTAERGYRQQLSAAFSSKPPSGKRKSEMLEKSSAHPDTSVKKKHLRLGTLTSTPAKSYPPTKAKSHVKVGEEGKIPYVLLVDCFKSPGGTLRSAIVSPGSAKRAEEGKRFAEAMSKRYKEALKEEMAKATECSAKVEDDLFNEALVPKCKEKLFSVINSPTSSPKDTFCDGFSPVKRRRLSLDAEQSTFMLPLANSVKIEKDVTDAGQTRKRKHHLPWRQDSFQRLQADSSSKWVFKDRGIVTKAQRDRRLSLGAQSSDSSMDEAKERRRASDSEILETTVTHAKEADAIFSTKTASHISEQKKEVDITGGSQKPQHKLPWSEDSFKNAFSDSAKKERLKKRWLQMTKRHKQDKMTGGSSVRSQNIQTRDKANENPHYSFVKRQQLKKEFLEFMEQHKQNMMAKVSGMRSESIQVKVERDEDMQHSSSSLESVSDIFAFDNSKWPKQQGNATEEQSGMFTLEEDQTKPAWDSVVERAIGALETRIGDSEHTEQSQHTKNQVGKSDDNKPVCVQEVKVVEGENIIAKDGQKNITEDVYMPLKDSNAEKGEQNIVQEKNTAENDKKFLQNATLTKDEENLLKENKNLEYMESSQDNSSSSAKHTTVPVENFSQANDVLVNKEITLECVSVKEDTPVSCSTVGSVLRKESPCVTAEDTPESSPPKFEAQVGHEVSDGSSMSISSQVTDSANSKTPSVKLVVQECVQVSSKDSSFKPVVPECGKLGSRDTTPDQESLANLDKTDETQLDKIGLKPGEDKNIVPELTVEMPCSEVSGLTLGSELTLQTGSPMFSPSTTLTAADVLSSVAEGLIEKTINGSKGKEESPVPGGKRTSSSLGRGRGRGRRKMEQKDTSSKENQPSAANVKVSDNKKTPATGANGQGCHQPLQNGAINLLPPPQPPLVASPKVGRPPNQLGTRANHITPTAIPPLFVSSSEGSSMAAQSGMYSQCPPGPYSGSSPAQPPQGPYSGSSLGPCPTGRPSGTSPGQWNPGLYAGPSPAPYPVCQISGSSVTQQPPGPTLRWFPQCPPGQCPGSSPGQRPSYSGYPVKQRRPGPYSGSSAAQPLPGPYSGTSPRQHPTGPNVGSSSAQPLPLLPGPYSGSSPGQCPPGPNLGHIRGQLPPCCQPGPAYPRGHLSYSAQALLQNAQKSFEQAKILQQQAFDMLKQHIILTEENLHKMRATMQAAGFTETQIQNQPQQRTQNQPQQQMQNQLIQLLQNQPQEMQNQPQQQLQTQPQQQIQNQPQLEMHNQPQQRIQNQQQQQMQIQPQQQMQIQPQQQMEKQPQQP